MAKAARTSHLYERCYGPIASAELQLVAALGAPALELRSTIFHMMLSTFLALAANYCLYVQALLNC